MKNKLKISASAYRVLLLLKKLNERDHCIDDLNSAFWEDPYVKRYFSKEVILKYINTLKISGYDIVRLKYPDKYCYRLNNTTVSIEFSNEELKTMALLKKYAACLHQNRLMENYDSFIEKFKRFMTEEQLQKLEKHLESVDQNNNEVFSKFNEYADLIKKIEQFIIEKQRVEIKFKTKDEDTSKLVLSELQNIKYEPNSVCVICYDIVSGQTKSININNIIDIKQLPVVTKSNQVLCPVIFKIKGRLAKVYRPYEKEKLTEFDRDGHLIVTSYPDDIDSLLKRLLRYGDNCEVTYPKMVRERMVKLIEKTLANYNYYTKTIK